MLNPGTAPLDNAAETQASANIAAFAAAIAEQGVEVGEPTRDPEADRDGRFGFRLTGPGGTVAVLMPGVPLGRVRDDLSAAAPCLYVGGEAWWWPSAVVQAVGVLR